MYVDKASAGSSPSIAEFKADLLKAMPKLRAYSRALCRQADRADDLVQETLLKALANIHTFESGSNLLAWLYTILRNEFYSVYRKRRHEVEDVDDRYATLVRIHPSQEGHIHFLDIQDALNRLPTKRREALMLIASGMSYEDAAALCRCRPGTVKSRVCRARASLTLMVK